MGEVDSARQTRGSIFPEPLHQLGVVAIPGEVEECDEGWFTVKCQAKHRLQCLPVGEVSMSTGDSALQEWRPW